MPAAMREHAVRCAGLSNAAPPVIKTARTARTLEAMNRWAVVTGTSTGLGRAIALRLAREGVRVFAGVRRAADAEIFKTAPNITPLILDVSKEDDIAQAVKQISTATATDGLWALVNNAGMVVPGPIEHVTLPDWRRQFDVNFFGIIALTQQCLPLLRRAVGTLGLHVPRIMIVSSIGGRISQPINAPYTTSKWAATALGDALRLELRRQGIGVTVIEPGAIATAIWGKGEEAARGFTADHPASRLYGPEISGLEAAAKGAASSAIAAEKAADIAVAALLKDRAPARVLVGRDAKIGAFLRRWFPLSWFDALLLQQYGISKAPIGIPADSK
jgi:NAD(P)-dependent dehydrogenase (short-subunit alcohol dehydrogenase family)